MSSYQKRILAAFLRRLHSDRSPDRAKAIRILLRHQFIVDAIVDLPAADLNRLEVSHA